MALLSALAPSTINSRRTFGSSRRSIDCRSAPARRRQPRSSPSTRASGCFAVGIDSERGDQHQIVAEVQAIDLDNQQVQLWTGQMPSTRPDGRPTWPQTVVRPTTSRCRPRRPPADHPPAVAPRAAAARRDVDQHQVHGPAAKPVLAMRGRPGRQVDLMPDVATHARPMHGHLAAVEADLASYPSAALRDARRSYTSRR